MFRARGSEYANVCPLGPALDLNAHTCCFTAAETLDKVLQTLSAQFAEGVDYFQLLVSAFQEVCVCVCLLLSFKCGVRGSGVCVFLLLSFKCGVRGSVFSMGFQVWC